ncbi:DUF2971 domain-containing protein [Belnapia rosea]|uniref:DUF2971 domain-containing protein n=1 Tax=Belnapia rosea TaxID=938405 RepID=UPI0015A0C329|nr:DUF2971 domain-containing protein [Belnapia rosea]
MNDANCHPTAQDAEGAPWSPPPLFKYVTLERALKILQTAEIRFTQPHYLNDPHELSVEINPQSLLRDFYEHLLRKGVPAATAAGIATRNISGLVIDQVRDVVAEREKIGILSLCDSPENMLLWAHYGDEHRGAVLELDVSQLIQRKADPGIVQVLAEITYSDERIDYIAKNFPLWMTLAFKSKAWAYEREWRLFKSLSMLRHKIDDIYVDDLPPSAIKRVIFGARAVGPNEEATIDFIQQSATHRHIEIYKAVFSSGLIGLDLKSGADFAGMILHGEHHFGDHWRELRQWVDFSKMKNAEKGEGLPPVD